MGTFETFDTILELCWRFQLGDRSAAWTLSEIDRVTRDEMARIEPRREMIESVAMEVVKRYMAGEEEA